MFNYLSRYLIAPISLSHCYRWYRSMREPSYSDWDDCCQVALKDQVSRDLDRRVTILGATWIWILSNHSPKCSRVPQTHCQHTLSCQRRWNSARIPCWVQRGFQLTLQPCWEHAAIMLTCSRDCCQTTVLNVICYRLQYDRCISHLVQRRVPSFNVLLSVSPWLRELCHQPIYTTWEFP